MGGQGEGIIGCGPGLGLSSAGSALGVREGKRNLWSARKRTWRTTLESDARTAWKRLCPETPP